MRNSCTRTRVLLQAITVYAVFPAILLACGRQAQGTESTPQHVLIWKFDDLKAGSLASKASGIQDSVRNVAAWAAEKRSPVSLGIICNSLEAPLAEDADWIKSNAIENGGWIEFWNHGWDHGKVSGPDGKAVSFEFKGTDLAYQTLHLQKSMRVMRLATGLTFRVFGAPYNAYDGSTAQALDTCAELTVWLYGPPADPRRTVLHEQIRLEYKTGKVSFEKFMAQYEKLRAPPCLVLQGHPPYWDGESLAAFKRIAAVLAANGWLAQTPSAYASGLLHANQ